MSRPEIRSDVVGLMLIDVDISPTRNTGTKHEIGHDLLVSATRQGLSLAKGKITFPSHLQHK